MLPAQVEYWKLQETKRHNEVSEQQGWFGLTETQRHNLTTEDVSYQSLEETQRHNLVTEGISRGQLAIAAGQLSVSQGQLSELIRHNNVYEGETFRHNSALEGIETRNVEAKERQNEIADYNARTQRLVGFMNAGTAAKDASTRAKQLEISQQEADISQQQADTAQYRANIEAFKAGYGVTKDVIDALSKEPDEKIDEYQFKWGPYTYKRTKKSTGTWWNVFD